MGGKGKGGKGGGSGMRGKGALDSIGT